MILLVHMLFGAAVGSLFISHPILAIAMALASHYFLDLFPHIEYLESTENSIKKLQQKKLHQNTKDLVKVGLDFLLGLLLVFIFSNNQPILYVCAIVAIIPDGLTVLHSLLPNKLLQKHHQIHGGKIHYLTKQKKFPVAWKIATQVVAVGISILILWR